MKNIGIQLNPDTLDLSVKNGGLSIGEVTEQNQYLIIKSHKGEFKSEPTLGVGIDDMVGDDDITWWKRRITEELQKDGMKVKSISLTDTLDIVAEY